MRCTAKSRISIHKLFLQFDKANSFFPIQYQKKHFKEMHDVKLI